MNRRALFATIFSFIASATLLSCSGADRLSVDSPLQDQITADKSPIHGVANAIFDSNAIVEAHENVLANIYESVLPSVVQIRVEQDSNSGEGSGFVWDNEGHIITNHHVIQGVDGVTVLFADGSEYQAEVLGTDPTSDLAVLKINPLTKPLTALKLGDSSNLRVGQLVVAIGNPFGQEFTMTSGIVSALGRTILSGSTSFATSRIIQTDAPINPGNSGGPLLDREGRIIGITSQIVSNSGANAGVGFAVPINTAKRIVPALIFSGIYQYAFLGISGTSLDLRLAQANNISDDVQGVLILEIVDDSPAAKSGLRGSTEALEVNGHLYPVGGDVITRIDNITVKGMDDLIALLDENYKPGDAITLDVFRNGIDMYMVDVTLGLRPDTNNS